MGKHDHECACFFLPIVSFFTFRFFLTVKDMEDSALLHVSKFLIDPDNQMLIISLANTADGITTKF